MGLSSTRYVVLLPWETVMMGGHTVSRSSWNPLARPLLALRAIVNAPVKLWFLELPKNCGYFLSDGLVKPHALI